MIYHGDCIDVLRTLPEASIDACVTDPPYGLGFMAKEWDVPGGIGAFPMRRRAETDAVNTGASRQGGRQRSGPDFARRQARDARAFEADTERWAREVFRALKPGAHLCAFGGTRMFHRMASGVEDAGFEIRDCLSWLYGSGFPKSLNLDGGLGTALKPAWEPVILARKPTTGTVAQNVQTHGTGALNIDACRIGFASVDDEAESKTKNRHGDFGTGPRENIVYGKDDRNRGNYDPPGRWPANVLLDEDAAALLDAQSGELATCGGPKATTHANGMFGIGQPGTVYPDAGGASRFFYCAKASREERELGCYDIDPKQRDDSRKDGHPGGDNPRNRGVQRRGNHHPTVKPIELMRWLIRLVTPPGGTVLDPFMGSGTTGMACRLELRPFIGIEREAEYIAIAERRIAAMAPLFDGDAA